MAAGRPPLQHQKIKRDLQVPQLEKSSPRDDNVVVFLQGQ